jgi:hypothetical protein
MLFSSNIREKNVTSKHSDSESLALKTIDSKFFEYDQLSDSSSSQSYLNSSVREANEIARLQESFIKEVGPENLQALQTSERTSEQIWCIKERQVDAYLSITSVRFSYTCNRIYSIHI